MSNLVDHARRELTIIGEEPATIDWYCTVIDAFSTFGHSGGSASVAIPVLNRLLQFKSLAELTDDPDEWMEVDDDGLLQSRRDSECFSTDKGKTYIRLGEAERDDQGDMIRDENDNIMYPRHTSVRKVVLPVTESE